MADDNIPFQEIPWYRYTAVFCDVIYSIINNFCKNPTVRIICCALTASLCHICKLSGSRRGSHVAGIYVGVLMYADDLLLISSSCSDLHRMAKICMRWSNLYHDESILNISTTGRYTVVFSKPTVYNTVTFNTAIFFWYRYTAHPYIPLQIPFSFTLCCPEEPVPEKKNLNLWGLVWTLLNPAVETAISGASDDCNWHARSLLPGCRHVPDSLWPSPSGWLYSDFVGLCNQQRIFWDACAWAALTSCWKLLTEKLTKFSFKNHIQTGVNYNIWILEMNFVFSWSYKYTIVCNLSCLSALSSCLRTRKVHEFDLDCCSCFLSLLLRRVCTSPWERCKVLQSACLYVCLSADISKQEFSSRWDGRPFGHNRHRLKIGGLCPFAGSWVPI